MTDVKHLEIERIKGSYRDTDSHVFSYGESIIRGFAPAACTEFTRFLSSPAYSTLLSKQLIIPSEHLPDFSFVKTIEEPLMKNWGYFSQKRVWPITYPYEWSHDMLIDAANCTLDIQETLLASDFNLKDASAFNIQFALSNMGPYPFLIDSGSIEAIPKTRGIWLAYGQFTSHFILPLLLSKHFQLDFRPFFLANSNGLDVQSVYHLLGGIRRFSPSYFWIVTVPSWLTRAQFKQKSINYLEEEINESKLERNRMILQRTTKVLRRYIARAKKTKSHSVWKEYELNNTYSDEAVRIKDQFVKDVLQSIKPDSVIDLGCNTGRFSMIAAELGSKVVSIDSDSSCIDNLYVLARSKKQKILPLCIDICNPSPAAGWANQEHPSLFERLGQFDAVLALALVHHLIGKFAIPLGYVVELLNKLTRRNLIVELVDYKDPMFSGFLSARLVKDADFTIAKQLDAFSLKFNIVRQMQIPGMARVLLHLEKQVSRD